MQKHSAKVGMSFFMVCICLIILYHLFYKKQAFPHPSLVTLFIKVFTDIDKKLICYILVFEPTILQDENVDRPTKDLVLADTYMAILSRIDLDA
jgi:hypothetical protein